MTADIPCPICGGEVVFEVRPRMLNVVGGRAVIRLILEDIHCKECGEVFPS